MNSEKELISVVVVTYNSSDTIIETLDSIKAQTYSDLQLIIGDDCSTDNTVQIISDWLAKNKSRFRDIKFIRNKNNLGVTKNLNKCIENVDGKYFQTVSGDDWIEKCAIEEKYYFAETNALPVVLNKVVCFGNSRLKTVMMQEFMDECELLLKKDRMTQLHMNLIQNRISGVFLTFYNKDFFNKIGGFDETFPMLEDWPFAIKILEKGIPLVVLDKELTSQHYRISSGSLCGGMTNPVFLASCRKLIFRKCIPTLLKNGWIKDAKRLFIDNI